MSVASPVGGSEQELLARLHEEIAHASQRVNEIEVGIALSIALGRRRPAVACGGCQTPLEFEGIPARTNAGLRVPFRLLFALPGPSG